MKRMLTALVLLAGCGATQVKVEPLTIQPIHITVDVNLHDKDAANKDAAAKK